MPARTRQPVERSMQVRARKTRESILCAAASVFERTGYAAATLEDIVAEADVTKGALYFHFRSKAELAAAVIEQHFARWPNLILDVEALDCGFLDRVYALITAVARTFQDDPVARSAVRLGNEHLLIDADLPVPFVGWIDHITALLQRGKRSGELSPDLDCAAVARIIVASFFGIQEVSSRLHERKDLIERLDEWWAVMKLALDESGAGAKPVRKPAAVDSRRSKSDRDQMVSSPA